MQNTTQNTIILQNSFSEESLNLNLNHSFSPSISQQVPDSNPIVDTSFQEFFFSFQPKPNEPKLKRALIMKAEELYILTDLLILQRQKSHLINSCIKLIEKVVLEYTKMDDSLVEDITLSLDFILSKARIIYVATLADLSWFLKGIIGFDSYTCAKLSLSHVSLKSLSEDSCLNPLQCYFLKMRYKLFPGQMYSLESVDIVLDILKELLKESGYNVKLFVCNQFDFCRYLNLVVVDQSNTSQIVSKTLLKEILTKFEVKGLVTNSEEINRHRFVTLLILDDVISIAADIKICSIFQSEFTLFWYKLLPFQIPRILRKFEAENGLVLTPTGIYNKFDNESFSESHIHLLYSI